MGYRIDWNNQYTLVTYIGRVTLQDLREVGSAVAGDQRLDAIDYILVDLRSADLSQISFADTKIAASVDSVSVRYKSQLKMAMIIKDERQRQPCESYIEYSKNFQSSWSFAIFADFEEAKNWCEFE